MSYRCGICGAVTPAGQQRKVHVIERNRVHPPGREIAREIPVCLDHHRLLTRGRTFESLREECLRDLEPLEPVMTPVVLPPTPPPPPTSTHPVIIGRPAEMVHPRRNKRRITDAPAD